MTWFQGTATQNRYNVGQSYVMGGNKFRAEADGTFTKEKTGRSLVGSSQSPVLWGGVSRVGGSAAPGVGPGRQAVVPPDAATTGPGVAGVRVAGSAGGSNLGVGDVAMPPVKAGNQMTQLFFGGQPLKQDFSISDGADFENRWGEWGGALGGLGVMALDVVSISGHGVGVLGGQTERALTATVRSVNDGWGDDAFRNRRALEDQWRREGRPGWTR